MDRKGGSNMSDREISALLAQMSKEQVAALAKRFGTKKYVAGFRESLKQHRPDMAEEAVNKVLETYQSDAQGGTVELTCISCGEPHRRHRGDIFQCKVCPDCKAKGVGNPSKAIKALLKKHGNIQAVLEAIGFKVEEAEVTEEAGEAGEVGEIGETEVAEKVEEETEV
jgi:hypothetical protein